VDDPVNRLIVEREGLDAGFPGSVVLSVILHLLTLGAAVAAPLVFPPGPVLKVMDGFAVVLPRGGGGSSAAPAAAAPAVVPSAAPSAEPETPVAPPPPKVIKPPKEEQRTGLPDIDQKRSKTKPATPPPPIRGAATAPTSGRAATAGSTAAGTGTSSRTPGLEFGPPGIGVPDGTDSGGDWYMASVQQKIWMLWTQQVKSGFTQPVGVTFTILADGSVTDVQVTQSSGATLLDLAAQRAVQTASPFGPLPKDYGTTRKTVQALFKPTS
jgi:protein TonB